jgi:hypothetical protein
MVCGAQVTGKRTGKNRETEKEGGASAPPVLMENGLHMLCITE